MVAIGLLLITLAVWLAIKMEDEFPSLDLQKMIYAAALSRLGFITLVVSFAFSYLE